MYCQNCEFRLKERCMLDGGFAEPNHIYDYNKDCTVSGENKETYRMKDRNKNQKDIKQGVYNGFR